MTAKGKKTKAKKTVKKTDQEAITTIVKREISRNIEDKTFQKYVNLYLVPPSNAGDWPLSSIPISPAPAFIQIDQGTGQGNRIGNKIKLTKLRMTGCITPRQYDEASNPRPRPGYCILWFYSYKPQQSADIAPNNSFLQLGGTAQALTNSPMDLGAPVNTDNWMLLGRKIFKIGFESYNSGTGILPNYGNFANNDFKLAHNFDIDCLPMAVKNVTFNDNSSIPSTRLLLCIPQAVAAVSQYQNYERPFTLQYVTSCSFEDA